MKLQIVLFLTLAVFCLAKPAKRSADGGTQANDAVNSQASTDNSGNEDGNTDTTVKKKCPSNLACVAPNLCDANNLRPHYNCSASKVCCYKPKTTSQRRKRSNPAPPPPRKHRRRRPRPHPEEHKEAVPAYMDFYDDNYETHFGDVLSPHAKEIYKGYQYTTECGVRHESPQLIGRVSSGYLNERGLTSFGEFPWHIAILVKERVFRRPYLHVVRPREDVRYKCGGSLINDKFIITAAHCVFGERQSRLKVHLGEWNLHGSTGELFPAVQRTIASIHIHNGFNPTTYVNDIALLRMDAPVHFAKTPHISPVCLPSGRFEDHKRCYVVGWGDDVYKPNFGSNILRAVSVLYTADVDVCRAKFFTSLEDNVASASFNLDQLHHKCIIGEYGKDACVGDGGGAVVCPLSNAEASVSCNRYRCANEHYFIAGIVSFGSPTCGADAATIITDVLPSLNWIAAITAHPY